MLIYRFAEPDIVITTTQQGSFEVIESAMEEQIVPENRVLPEAEQEADNNKDKIRDEEDFVEKPGFSPTVDVRDKVDAFTNRPALATIDPTYRMKMKGASAVATRSDGSKFIGKIKLIKKEEEPPEEDDVEETPKKQGPDYVLPDVVKERLDSYQEVILRNKGSRSKENSR